MKNKKVEAAEKTARQRKRQNVWFIIGTLLLFLLAAAVLELGRYTFLGWALVITAFMAHIAVHYVLLRDKRWYFRAFSLALLCFVFFLLLKLSAPPEQRVPVVSVKNPEKTEVITVETGDLQGLYNEDKSVEIFAAIPYAAPPVGNLRWKEPAPAEPWDGVRCETAFAPMAMQDRGSTVYNALVDIVFRDKWNLHFGQNYLEEMSEDCLYLNVWKPAGDISDAPVLVYIHGGSLTSGQSYYEDYNGETMAKNGIVFVTVAYRLNVFGYFASEELAAESAHGTTGDYGLLDQIAALRWVNENIEAFGGDSSNITIAGESAGSSSVNALCVSPLSKGLFVRAIGESSGIVAKVPYHTFRTMEEALSEGEKTYADFNASNINELRSIPAEELLKTTGNNSGMTVDGYAITEQPYLTYENNKNHEEALLNGFNADEARVFLILANQPDASNYHDFLTRVVGDFADEVEAVLPGDTNEEAKEHYNTLMGIAWFAYSHDRWSDLLADQGKPVYKYYFTKDNKGLGVYHSGEVPYVYGNLYREPQVYDESDQALSEVWVQYVVNFCRTGDPNGGELPAWPRYNDDRTMVQELGEHIGPVEDPNLQIYDILDKYMDSIAE